MPITTTHPFESVENKVFTVLFSIPHFVQTRDAIPDEAFRGDDEALLKRQRAMFHTDISESPEFDTLRQGLEQRAINEVKAEWLGAAEIELHTCLNIASELKEPGIGFSTRVAGTQYLMEFFVRENAEPESDNPPHNLHGHNMDRVKYAGCVCLQNGQVSRHH